MERVNGSKMWVACPQWIQALSVMALDGAKGSGEPGFQAPTEGAFDFLGCPSLEVAVYVFIVSTLLLHALNVESCMYLPLFQQKGRDPASGSGQGGRSGARPSRFIRGAAADAVDGLSGA